MDRSCCKQVEVSDLNAAGAQLDRAETPHTAALAGCGETNIKTS